MAKTHPIDCPCLGDAWKADGYPTLSPTLSPVAKIVPEPTKSPVWKGKALFYSLAREIFCLFPIRYYC